MSSLVRILEKLVLLALSAGAIWRLWPVLGAHPQIALLLLSELIGVFFLLIQRKGTWSSSAYTTVIAFLGTGLALCVKPEGVALASETLTMAIMMLGTGIALLAKLSLRRSFGLIPANRGVKVDGAYRFVRHPMYTGYVINHTGFMLIYFSAWNVIIYAATWTLLYLRAIEEERFLLQDPEYDAYAKTVKARIIPGLI